MKTTTLKPLSDRIFVKRDDTPTSIGLIALAGQQPAPESGTVVAVGPGKRNKSGSIVPLSVSVGDRVMFGRYVGATIKSEVGPLLTLREGEILGVLEAGA